MTNTPTGNLEKKVEEAGGVEGEKTSLISSTENFHGSLQNKRNPPLINIWECD